MSESERESCVLNLFLEISEGLTYESDARHSGGYGIGCQNHMRNSHNQMFVNSHIFSVG